MTGYEQLRRSIRRRFGNGKPFSVIELQQQAPELSHLLHLKDRVWMLVRSGFLRVVKLGPPATTNRFARRKVETKFLLCEVSKGDCTVMRDGKRFVLRLNRRLTDRMDEVTDSLEISAVAYIREIVETDLARRAQ